MSVHAWVYVCVHRGVHAQVCMHGCACVGARVCVRAEACVRAWVQVCVCTGVYAWVCMHGCGDVCVYRGVHAGVQMHRGACMGERCLCAGGCGGVTRAPGCLGAQARSRALSTAQQRWQAAEGHRHGQR